MLGKGTAWGPPASATLATVLKNTDKPKLQKTERY